MFLRSRRERIVPDQVGLPEGSRRRTPGLRREEVASLAGVGVTWYTWLEQGRDIRASEQVLAAIAATLRLDPYERQHLFTLAGLPLARRRARVHVAHPGLRCCSTTRPISGLRDHGRYDVLAYNRAYVAVSGDLDSLPIEERNNLWLAFASADRRALVVDWEEATRRIVGMYRSAMADHVGEPAWNNLVQRLKDSSPEFRELWHRHDVEDRRTSPSGCCTRRPGCSHSPTTACGWPPIGARLMTYTPRDDRTEPCARANHELEPPPLRLGWPPRG